MNKVGLLYLDKFVKAEKTAYKDDLGMNVVVEKLVRHCIVWSRRERMDNRAYEDCFFYKCQCQKAEQNALLVSYAIMEQNMDMICILLHVWLEDQSMN